jgi:hypothetical protein
MRKELVQLVGLAVVITAVEIALPVPTWLRGFVVGFFLTACVAIVGFAFLLNGDAAYLIAGALGESHTSEELEAAMKAGLIWSCVPNVEASGRDVDHIVLAPSGVLALETKWRFKGANNQWLHASAEKADKAARQARLVMQAKPIDLRTAVTPVVVVWGGARRELPLEQLVAGVAVVRGEYLLTWLERCSRGRLAQDHAEQLQSKLVAFAASHHAATGRDAGAPPSR